jgi:hypothetical protein
MESRFDALAKALAQSGSRREALKRLAGAAAAAALTVVGISCAPDDLVGPKGRATRPLFANGRCKKNDHKCRENDECCSGLCDPLTGYCTCEAGKITCPASGQCIPACGALEVLNPNTCLCECEPGTTSCGSTCCPTGTICCNGDCQVPCGGNCCPPGTQCCGTTCTSLLSDPNNCGICGRICPVPFNRCQNGTCVCANPCFSTLFGTQCCLPGQVCNSFLGCV